MMEPPREAFIWQDVMEAFHKLPALKDFDPTQGIA